MKKKIAFSAFLLFFIFSSFSNDFSFSITPGPITNLSLKKSEIREYVYQQTLKNKYEKLSELDWPVDWLVFYSVDASLKWKFLSLEGTFSFTSPQNSGTMIDSDWLNIMVNPQMKTNISYSENHLDCDYIWNVKLVFDIYQNEIFSFQPYLSIDFDYISFSAKNGYGFYGDPEHSKTSDYVPYDSPYAKKYEKGQLLGIDFLREAYNYSIGIRYKFTYPRFFISPYIQISPYTTVNSIDTHHSSGNSAHLYYDKMHGFFSAFSAGISSVIHLTDKLYLNLSADYYKLSTIYGNSYYKGVDNLNEVNIKKLKYNLNSSVKGAASADSFSAQLGLTLKF